MKEYNGEKGIISLTSWKARINTVSRTLVNLMDKCPEFHIVLVLSEEEFPGKMADMPDDIRLLADAGFFEILWVYKNYRAFKKVLFTMDKYRDVPVISADDDAIYTFNYAAALYNEYLRTGGSASFWGVPYKNTMHTGGVYTLHAPYWCGKYGIECLDDRIVALNEDDNYYSVLKSRLGYNNISIIHHKDVFGCHDEVTPLHNVYRKRDRATTFRIIEDILDSYGLPRCR